MASTRNRPPAKRRRAPGRRPPRRNAAAEQRRKRIRAAWLLALAVALGISAALIARQGDVPGVGRDARGDRLLPGSAAGDGVDPLRYDESRRAAFEARAAAGLAHPLYAKSPGGAVATAERVARWRPLVEAATEGSDVDPDVLEAIVFLESAGRPDAQASSDLDGAAGLTQILAETGTNLLKLQVDVRKSTKLTRGIARGTRVEARERERRRVDERFDPAKALAATVRYLAFAKGELGRDDLAVVSYHMGVGNLQTALSRYGEDDIPYAQLFFDSTPLHHASAYAKLASLGDDSSTYLWRVRAAERIMALWREDPDAVARRAALQTGRNSAELVLHPQDDTDAFDDPDDVQDAIDDGDITRLDTTRLRGYGLVVSPSMGELAGRLDRRRQLYRALRPEALAVLEYLGAGTRAIAGGGALIVTSSVRDGDYQRLLTQRNIEATRSGYSLHATGYAFDVSRTYASRAQARAFQFLLDRLTALDVIAWVREPGAIHVTAGPRAAALGRLPAAASIEDGEAAKNG